MSDRVCEFVIFTSRLVSEWFPLPWQRARIEKALRADSDAERGAALNAGLRKLREPHNQVQRGIVAGDECFKSLGVVGKATQGEKKINMKRRDTMISQRDATCSSARAVRAVSRTR